jgi:ABC-type transport system involved in multi-copper enzyme maturation permease subunit
LLRVAVRRGWVTLLGPVFFFEMVRAGRSPRVNDVRLVYCIILYFVLLVTYCIAIIGVNLSLAEGFFSPKLSAKLLTDFLLVFFLLFMAIQYLAALILTPAYLAGAIAEERDRNTLEALLATDLGDREIVLGIVLPRLVNLLLIFLAGMPILSFLQFLGGIEPNLVLAGFAFLGLTVLSIAGIGVVFSLYARRSRSALLRTYLLVFGYLALSGLSPVIVSSLNLGQFPSTDTWISPVTAEDVVEWCNGGNLIYWFVHIVNGIFSGSTLDATLPPALTAYAWFHGGIAAICTLWIGLRFRAVILAPARGVGVGSHNGEGTAWLLGLNGRPAVFNRPMLWKELYPEAGRPRRRRQAFGWSLLLAILAVPLLTCIYFFDGFSSVWHSAHVTDLINLWIRYLTLGFGSAMLVSVAVRAAGSVAGERDQGTLDGMLATPLTTRTILWNKWLASVLSPRRSALALALVWAIGLIAGALHPLAVLCVAFAWFSFAALAAAVGLWFSVIQKTSHGATFWTIATLAFVLLCTLILFEDLRDLLPPFEAQTVFPPLTLWLSSFSAADLELLRGPSHGAAFRLIPWWSLVWVGYAWGTWRLTLWRFRKLCNRKYDHVAAEPMDGSNHLLKDTDNGNSVTAVAAKRASIPWLRLTLTVFVLALPTCLLVGVFEYRRGAAHVALRQALAEADRLDFPWRGEDMEARRKEVPAKENAAVVVDKATNLLSSYVVRDFNDASQYLDAPSPRQLHPKVKRYLQRIITRSRAPLQEARRLAELPAGRFPRIQQDERNLAWGSSLGRSYYLPKFLGFAAILYAQDGEDEEAAVFCLAMINMARSVGNEVSGMAAYSRSEGVGAAVLTLEQILALATPSERALARLQKLLEDESRQPLLLQYFRCQRAVSDRLMELMISGESNWNPFFLDGRTKSTAAQGFVPPWRVVDVDTLFAGPLTSQRARLLEFFNALVEAAKLPEKLQDAAITQAKVRFAITTKLSGNFTYVVERVPAIRYHLARTRCAIAALACERYRAAHGKWPAELQELVPIYLTEIPNDPYDGKPLRFKRVQDGLVIYTVGPDQVDNGGKLLRNPRPVVGTDVGFQLWDPAHRRQPAGPPPKELAEPERELKNADE